MIVFLQLVPADTGTGDDGCWTLELRLGVGDLKKQDFNGKIMILSTDFRAVVEGVRASDFPMGVHCTRKTKPRTPQGKILSQKQFDKAVPDKN